MDLKIDVRYMIFKDSNNRSITIEVLVFESDNALERAFLNDRNKQEITISQFKGIYDRSDTSTVMIIGEYRKESYNDKCWLMLKEDFEKVKELIENGGHTNDNTVNE